MIWRDFEARAPALAGLGRERLLATRVAMLATLRPDGSPRLSPVGVQIALGHLLFGLMRSRKLDDVRLDARCALHSSVSDPEGSEGEFKLYGRALLMEDRRIRDGDYEAWWHSHPASAASVFTLDIESAAYVGWDVAAGELRVIRWSPAAGVTESRRPYP